MPGDPIPRLIRRNTILLVASQAFSGSSVTLVFSLGPLMVVALTGSVALAGFVVALFGATRFVGAYPLGLVTDRYGRRPGLIVSLVVATFGTVIVAIGMNEHSLLVFLVGQFAFGIGMNGVQQLRLAVAEMYPPHRRAVMIGWLLTGSLAGIAAAPALVSFGLVIAEMFGSDPLAMPWLLVPIVILPAILFIYCVRPDPKDIAADLRKHYPHLPTQLETTPARGTYGLRRFLAHPRLRVAALAMFSAQGSMQIAMVTAPIAMSHFSATLPAIAFSMSLHTAAMFGASVPMGKVTDLVGRRWILLAGTLTEAIGGIVTAFSADPVAITLGIVLVGLGWCGANVSSTALVVDLTDPAARGSAIGLIDTIAAIGGIIFPLSVGIIVEVAGIGATGILAMLLMVPPAALLAARGALWVPDARSATAGAR